MNIYKIVARSIIEHKNIYIETRNQFNTTQKQMYINHDEKTFKFGNFTMFCKNVATKGEMNDIESLLYYLDYRRTQE